MGRNIDVAGQMVAAMRGFSDRRMRAVAATAATRTVAGTRTVLMQHLADRLDRPRDFTLRAVKFVPATADRLTAYVGVDVVAVQDVRGATTGFRRTTDTPASQYLQPQGLGGGRRFKRFEAALFASGYLPAGWYAMPGPMAKIDGNGNMSAGQIKQILSQLRTTNEAGYEKNMARPNLGRFKSGRYGKVVAGAESSKVRAAVKRAGGRYFVIGPGQQKGKTPGVYLRDIGSRHAGLALAFVRTAPRYYKRLEMDEIVDHEFKTRFPQELQRAAEESRARMAARGR